MRVAPSFTTARYRRKARDTPTVSAAICLKKASPVLVCWRGLRRDRHPHCRRSLEGLRRIRLKDPLGPAAAEQCHDRGCSETGNTMPSIPLSIPVDGAQHLDDQFRAVLDTIPALVWITDPAGAAVYINRRWL